MSDIKIQPSATGSATVTLTAPVTNTARTITFPDSTGTILDSTSTLDATKLSGNLPALSAANLTAIPAANITGTLPAISGANLTGISSFDPDGAVVFNESGADVDFRVESNDKSHMLFVDGGTNRVGINKTGAPDVILDVQGTVSAGASTDEVIQEWSIGSDNVKANIEYTDASTSRGMNFGTSTQHDLILKTNDTTRMTIDYNGYVTQPSKRSAAFCARYSTSRSYSDGATVIYDGVANNWFSFNYGGGYSTSTGKFTAPVSGVYHFQGSAMTTGWGNGNNTQDLLGLIHTNGRLTYGFVRRSQHRTDAFANGYYTEACQVTCYMAAGNQVWLTVSQACGISNNHYSYFSGFLVA